MAALQRLLSIGFRPRYVHFHPARTFSGTVSHCNALHSINSGSRHRLLITSPYGVPQKCFLSRSTVLSSSGSAEVVSDAAMDLTFDSAGTVLNEVAAAASYAAEPTLKSLGLASSFPGGYVQAALESLHIGLDVPWWTAIVIGTLIIRFAMVPLAIISQRNAAEMQNHLPTMQRLQLRMSERRRVGDLQGSLDVSQELQEYMKRNKVSPFKNMLVPLAQCPVFIAVFTGVRQMATLPVVSMQTGGILWFVDLTIPDPYFALPLMTAATLFITLELGAEGVNAAQMPQQMRTMFRLMPLIMIPFIAKFPAAMLCYWLTSNLFSLVQVSVLRIPCVREYLKIPPLIDHKSLTQHIKQPDVPQQGFVASFRESMANARLAAEIHERQRYNSLNMRRPSQQHGEAGKTPRPDADVNEARTQSSADLERKTEEKSSKKEMESKL